MKSNTTFVLLDPFNKYVCFPASDGTTNCQIPGDGFSNSNIVTLNTTLFPEVTKLPRGSFRLIVAPLFSLETVTIIFSMVSSTSNLYTDEETLRFFLPGRKAIAKPPWPEQDVPLRRCLVTFFILAILELSFGSSKTWPQVSLASFSNGFKDATMGQRSLLLEKSRYLYPVVLHGLSPPRCCRP